MCTTSLAHLLMSVAICRQHVCFTAIAVLKSLLVLGTKTTIIVLHNHNCLGRADPGALVQIALACTLSAVQEVLNVTLTSTALARNLATIVTAITPKASNV